jgi:glycosyltransferase involved in cell wall biosynthesis
MKKIKLAFLTSKIDRNAQEEGFIADWAEALAKHVDELVIFILEAQKTKLKAKNIKVYSLDRKKTKIGKIIFLFKKFSQENKRKPFNGVFSHMYDFLGISAGFLGKLFKVKSIIWYAWGLNLKRLTLAELALRLNDIIVTCSHGAKARYQKAYKIKKTIIVLGHAINTDKFVNQRERRKEKEFSIGFIGRVIPEKNIETIIESTLKINKDHPIIVSLVLSASEKNISYLNGIKKLSKKLTRKNLEFKIIENLPHTKVTEYLNSLHLYIHPAKVYSIDKAPIEAICSGTPVLLSNYGYSGICKEYPEILFNPNNPQELVRKIDDAINSYKEFSDKQKSFQRLIRSSYSADEFMKKLVKLF